MTSPVRAVTFDFGQTLCDLCTDTLSRRLAERGIAAPAAQLEAAVPGAWRAYDAAIHRGLGGHPWKVLMSTLLELGGVGEAGRGAAVDWLWDEQPKHNLWRRPVAGMIELVDGLRGAGLAVGVISNSEGRLAELIEELGWAARFQVVADSGVLGVVKPAPEIFRWTLAELDVGAGEVVHVGDSFAADVQGAVQAGMRAIWFRGAAGGDAPATVRVAGDAAEVRAALRGWGVDA